MSAPTSEEILLLTKFRTQLTDLNLTGPKNRDVFLIRWIRARDGDLEKAENMLRKSLKWREENDIDNILSWYPSPELEENAKLKFLGYDRDNSPVVWTPTGQWDVKEIVSSGRKQEFVKYLDRFFIQSIKHAEGMLTKENYPVTQIVCLVDMEDLSILSLVSVAVVDMLLQCVKSFEANHPEIAKKILIVNAGYAFEKLFSLIKPFFSPKTRAKLTVMAKTTEENMTTVLQDAIPLEVLPVQYGGRNEI